MKKLQNNFTTPEQSKRLLELGVPIDSADCYFLSTDGITTWIRGVADKNMNWFGTIDRTPIPCWSVGRLIEIMTICYKWNLLSSASLRIYVTDIIGRNLINKFINDLSLEISRGKIDFSKLEE